jgi:hypothetical protein
VKDEQERRDDYTKEILNYDFEMQMGTIRDENTGKYRADEYAPQIWMTDESTQVAEQIVMLAGTEAEKALFLQLKGADSDQERRRLVEKIQKNTLFQRAYGVKNPKADVASRLSGIPLSTAP